MPDFFDDDHVDQHTDRRLALRLLPFIAPYWKFIVLSSVMSLVMALLQLAGPYIVKEVIDNHITKRIYRGIPTLSGLYIAAIMVLFVSEYAQGRLIAYVGQRSMFDLRARIFSHVQNLSLSFFDRNPVGRLMTRITSDVAALNELFAQGVMTLAGDIFLLIAIAGILVHINITMAFIVFLTAPLLLYSAMLFRKNVRKSYREVRLSLSRMNSYLQENLSGMRTIQAYNRGPRNFGHFQELNEDYRVANVRGIFYYAVFFPVIENIVSLAIAGLIYYGGTASLKGTVSLGTVVLFIQFTQRFFRPIQDLTEKFNIFQTAMASSERVFKLLDAKPEVQNRPEPHRLPEFRESIHFENVWFAYKEEEWVLREINFTVKRGETIAIVGATGSGKTTLISLLARFYDVQKGAVRIDGVDIRDYDLDDLRNKMAIVLQDNFLFSGDISSNIRLGNEEIDDERVQRCAEYVNASSFIEGLAHGYHEEVLERGATLSVGQKQLLAFARALAFDPAILILDEATASIDTETEQLIQDALRKLLRNRTSIVIAHRLSTIQNSDRIIVMSHGKIREEGNHQELLARNGIYRKLYDLQYRPANGGMEESA